MQYDYMTLWGHASVLISKQGVVNTIVDKIVANKATYEAAAKECNMPWFVIACIHELEAGLNFHTILANGDPLGEPTRHVPAGLIANTWADGVKISIDYERRQGNSLVGRTINAILYYLERYNGLGYRRYGVPTPYLWSFTNNYIRGKFTADREYSSSAISQQCGCVPILLTLIQRGIIFVSGDTMSENPIQDVVTGVEDTAAGASLGAAVADANATRQPKASDYYIPLPSPTNGTAVDPAEVVAHDLLLFIGSIIVYAGAHGIISAWFQHWAYGILTAFGGTTVAAIAVFLRRVSVQGTSQNVQHLINQG